MTISDPKSKTVKDRMLPYIYFFMVATVFSLMSVVVIMLVTGSVNVINDRFFHFAHIDIVTMIIAAVIILASVLFFLRKSGKIFRFIEQKVIHRT